MGNTTEVSRLNVSTATTRVINSKRRAAPRRLQYWEEDARSGNHQQLVADK